MYQEILTQYYVDCSIYFMWHSCGSPADCPSERYRFRLFEKWQNGRWVGFMRISSLPVLYNHDTIGLAIVL
jgi:hypothetical protein